MSVKRNRRGPWLVSRFGPEGRDLFEILRGAGVEATVIGQNLEIRLPEEIDISFDDPDGFILLTRADGSTFLKVNHPRR